MLGSDSKSQKEMGKVGTQEQGLGKLRAKGEVGRDGAFKRNRPNLSSFLSQIVQRQYALFMSASIRHPHA